MQMQFIFYFYLTISVWFSIFPKSHTTKDEIIQKYPIIPH